MKHSLLLAWSSPVEGREADFDEWYDGTHIPQVRAALPDVGQVTRYQLVDVEGTGGPDRYLAIYELGTDDVTQAATALGAAAASGALDMTDAMDVAGAPPQLQWLVKHAD